MNKNDFKYCYERISNIAYGFRKLGNGGFHRRSYASALHDRILNWKNLQKNPKGALLDFVYVCCANREMEMWII